MKKRYLFIIIISITLLVTGLATKNYIKKQGFESISPIKGDVTEAVYGLGTVKSLHFYEFKAGLIMNIINIFVKEGDFVTSNSPLIQLNGGLIVKAPFDGTITDLPFHNGENIPVGQAVIQLQDLKNKYIEVSLEQESALRVNVGQKCKVMFESLRGQVYQGKVSALFPKNGNFIVHIDVEALTAGILPGMTADVSIEIGQDQNVLLIPLSSIDSGQVILTRNGEKKKIKVTIGHVDNNWAEVLEGDILLTDKVLIPKLKKQKR